jgi:hypothetical protein
VHEHPLAPIPWPSHPRADHLPIVDADGATAEELAAAFGHNVSTTRSSVKTVRDWLGSVRHVEVFPMAGVRTPIIRKTSTPTLPTTCRTDCTLFCEQPQKPPSYARTVAMTPPGLFLVCSPLEVATSLEGRFR